MQADGIDQYLDLLKRRLPEGDPRVARLIGEAERDLRAAAERFSAGGWTREDARAWWECNGCPDKKELDEQVFEQEYLVPSLG